MSIMEAAVYGSASSGPIRETRHEKSMYVHTLHSQMVLYSQKEHFPRRAGLDASKRAVASEKRAVALY